MIPPPLQHSSCSSKVISTSASPKCFTVLAFRGFLEHLVIHGCGTCGKSRLLRHCLARQVWFNGAECGRYFWLETWTERFASYCPKCSGTGGHCIRTNTWSSQNFCVALRAQVITWRHPRTQVVSRACRGSHHERTTIPKNTSCEWNGFFVQRVQGCHGSYWLCANWLSEPVIGTVCNAAVGSVRTGRVFDASSDHEDRSSDVCYVGDTR